METIRVPFSRELRSFLTEIGYSHIYSFGIVIEPNEIEDSETYLLIPLRPGDPRILYEETDKIVEELSSNDVFDMADGDEFISFVLELPEDEFAIFNQNK